MKKLGTFVCALVTVGCVTSEPVVLPTSGGGGQPIVNATGAAGQVGAAGQTGAAGMATNGGAGMVVNNTTGAAGSSSGSGTAGSTGAAGVGGQAGQNGSTGTAGAAGSGSSVDAGAPKDAGGDAVSAYSATWTDIYKMLNDPSYPSNCTGAGCHDPGTQKGLDLSTQAKGYTTIKTKLVAGNPSASTLVSQLSSGRMPQARPKMPTVDLNVIKAWIMAGALNN